MPIQQLDVQSRVSAIGSWTPTGGTLVEVLSDASDATYARSAAKNVRVTFSTTNPVAPTGVLVSVCPFVRAKRPGSIVAKAVVCTYALGKIVSRGVFLTIPKSADAANFELPAHRGCKDLGWIWLYTRPDIDAPRFVYPLTADEAAIGLIDSSTTENRATVYRAYLKAYYLLAPTIAAPSAPSGTLTDTQMPDLTAEVGCVVESWQLPTNEAPWLCEGDVEYQIFRAADVPGGATSPPAMVTPVWSGTTRFLEMTYGDGATPSTQDVTMAVDSPLANDSYVLFARASRDTPKGAQQHWSAWASAAFEIDLELPTTPTLSAAADDDAQRVDLSLNVSSTAGYDGDAMTATVQRSDDGGASWTDVRGCVAAPVGVGNNLLPPDYEAPRGQNVTYRARITDVLTADSSTIASEWDEETVPSYAATGWNLKVPTDATLNWLAAPVTVNPSASLDQQVTIFRPLGRGSAVAVSSANRGEVGTLEISASGDAAIAKLLRLIDCDAVLYVETAYGEGFYARVTEANWQRAGMRDAPRRPCTLQYSQVGRPAVA